MAKSSLEHKSNTMERRKFSEDPKHRLLTIIICEKKSDARKKASPLGTIKKKTRSLIISVEAQEFVKRHSSAWRAARKSAGVIGLNTRGLSYSFVCLFARPSSVRL